MIVYGDPGFTADVDRLAERLRARIPGLNPPLLTNGTCLARVAVLDRFRDLLVEAGQLEQAFADLPDNGAASGRAGSSRLQSIQSITEAAAEAFCTVRETGRPGATTLSRLRGLLEGLGHVQAEARVRVPEGFAFYRLYPEQYGEAALAWAAEHPSALCPRVLVVGIRSIGTTLSAVVSAALAGTGRQVRRITLRPVGPPFDRRAHVEPAIARGSTGAIVVDEGPGLSGSSMAAVASALSRAGMDAAAISFMPGHAREPGSQAGESTRAWWARTRRYVVPLENLRWFGLPFHRVLACLTGELTGCTGPVQVQDLSAGRWRDVLSDGEREGTVAWPSFERAKYRCVDGTGRKVLWKFGGFAGGAGGIEGHGGAAGDFETMVARAREGWTRAPLGCGHGFVAQPWIEGKRLRADPADNGSTRMLARYVAASRGPAMSRATVGGSRQRLGEILECNAREGVGEAAACRARSWSREVASLWVEGLLAGHDSHLAPHEWVSADGRVFKTDCVSHACGHTAPGLQPSGWDLAAAMVEWRLAPNGRADLLATAAAAGLGPVDRRLVDYCRAAYAAFRMGECRQEMAAGHAGLQRASEGYERYLAEVLEEPGR
jgi:hypothetical protein